MLKKCAPWRTLFCFKGVGKMCKKMFFNEGELGLTVLGHMPF